jgi:hypothetical protein
VSIKQEVIRIGDSDDEEGAQQRRGTQQLQQQQQQQQLTGPLLVPQLLQGAPAEAAAAAAAGMAAGAVGVIGLAAAPQRVAPDTPMAAAIATQPDAMAAIPSNAAAAATSPVLLPPGMQLPDAASAAAMEQHLTVFMGKTLRPLLPRKQYSRLLEQLRLVFKRYKHEQGVSAEQLQTMYLYVQGAVDGGEVCKVVSTLEDSLGLLLP